MIIVGETHSRIGFGPVPKFLTLQEGKRRLGIHEINYNLTKLYIYLFGH